MSKVTIKQLRLLSARQVGKTFLVRELAKGFANYLEVKGGTTGSMKGLHLYLNEKHVDFAVRFSADSPSRA